MISIERNFKRIQNKKPDSSDFGCFKLTVESKGFSKKIISYWFNKLVSKDDYLPSEKKDLISHLVSFSQMLEEGKK